MDRDLEQLPLERVVEAREGLDQGRARDRETSCPTYRHLEPRLYLTRGHHYRLTPMQLATMNDVGRFRTVAVTDLTQHRYSGEQGHAERDFETLVEQGLLQIKSARAGAGKPPMKVAVLTKTGRATVLEHVSEERGQSIYAGFVKAREVPHDAAIYRMFHAARGRIEREGGEVRRVILDYELKRNIYTPLATYRSRNPNGTAADYTRLQTEVATQFGLKVINGRIPLPDLRIEYVTASGELARIDLELATHHYHGGAMQAKAQAGFTFYAVDGSASRLARVLEEREITAAILSL